MTVPITAAVDIEGLLCGWLPRTLRVTDIHGHDHIVADVEWTDGRPVRVRDRAETKITKPYGTVTYLHTFDLTAWHTRPTWREQLVTVTAEALVGVAGQRVYQVRFRDVAEVVSVTVNAVAATALPFQTPAWATPDAIQLAVAPPAGAAILVTYKYRAYDVGSSLEMHEVYRIEGKTGPLTWTVGVNTYGLPASRVAKMWMDSLIQWLSVQGFVGGSGSVSLAWFGTDMAGSGLLPVEDETESRFVVDICLHRRARVFTKEGIRRVGRYGLEVVSE